MFKFRQYLKEGHSIDVDVFIAEGDFFKSMMNRRSAVEVEGRTYWLITPEDLLLMKLLAGRGRDMMDVGDILFLYPRLEEDYLRKWAQHLRVLPELERVLADPPLGRAHQ